MDVSLGEVGAKNGSVVGAERGGMLAYCMIESDTEGGKGTMGTVETS